MVTVIISGGDIKEPHDIEINADGSASFTGNVGIGTADPSGYDIGANQLVVSNTSSACGVTIASNTANTGNIFFADGTSGTAWLKVTFNMIMQTISFGGNVERMRVIAMGGCWWGRLTRQPPLVRFKT